MASGDYFSEVSSQGIGTPQSGGLGTASSSGSSSSGSSSQQTATKIIIGVSSQTFRCTGTGLRPNTVHKAYLLSTDVSQDCAPIVANGNSTTTYSYGAQLITDASGKLVFDYTFKPQDSPFTTQFIAAANTTVAIIPVGQQTFKVSSADGTSTASSYIESKQATS